MPHLSFLGVNLHYQILNNNSLGEGYTDRDTRVVQRTSSREKYWTVRKCGLSSLNVQDKCPWTCFDSYFASQWSDSPSFRSSILWLVQFQCFWVNVRSTGYLHLHHLVSMVLSECSLYNYRIYVIIYSLFLFCYLLLHPAWLVAYKKFYFWLLVSGFSSVVSI